MASDTASARALPTAEELELARVLDLARVLWAELKECDWPMTRLGLALADAEERGRAAALSAAEAPQASSSAVPCAICGKPATCIGQYDNMTAPAPACDSCCGHGNEDGHCEPLAEAVAALLAAEAPQADRQVLKGRNMTPDRRIEFRREQAQALLDFFGGDDETMVTVAPGDASSHSGPGLYAYVADYPDEGALFLGPEGEPDPPQEEP